MHVAFFRFMNLGHTGSPNRAQLEAAFAAGGAESVRSFQTNGTVLFTAEVPADTIAVVSDELEGAGIYTGVMFVRSLERITEIATADACRRATARTSTARP